MCTVEVQQLSLILEHCIDGLWYLGQLSNTIFLYQHQIIDHRSDDSTVRVYGLKSFG
jgi:hypothetical protein